MRALLLVACLLATSGCLDDELDPSMGSATNDVFIALQRDFQTFRSWTRIQVGEAEVVGGHPAGPRFAYLSRAPVDGAFPVGTIIVKTTEVGEPATWKIHARVKRGGGFNARGAIDWEWFDLRINASDEALLMWRGERPPANHGYESLPGLGATTSMDGDCNSCHAAARDSDFILAPAVRAMITPAAPAP